MALCHIIEECIACGACTDECPKTAISEGEPYIVDQSKCDGCGDCAKVCPVDACIIE